VGGLEEGGRRGYGEERWIRREDGEEWEWGEFGIGVMVNKHQSHNPISVIH
jgi:hypothetical protein